MSETKIKQIWNGHAWVGEGGKGKKKDGPTPEERANEQANQTNKAAQAEIEAREAATFPRTTETATTEPSPEPTGDADKTSKTKTSTRKKKGK